MTPENAHRLADAIDSLFAPDPRHAWLAPAAEQIKRWRAEDEANGQPWEPPYGPMCADPELCRGKGYCPRDPTCGD